VGISRSPSKRLRTAHETTVYGSSGSFSGELITSAGPAGHTVLAVGRTEADCPLAACSRYSASTNSGVSSATAMSKSASFS
jgi:hypothetical protein